MIFQLSGTQIVGPAERIFTRVSALIKTWAIWRTSILDEIDKNTKFCQIRLLNNIARYNLIYTKYRQMAFQSPVDGTPICPNQQSLGTPGQTKVSGDHYWKFIVYQPNMYSETWKN